MLLGRNQCEPIEYVISGYFPSSSGRTIFVRTNDDAIIFVCPRVWYAAFSYGLREGKRSACKDRFRSNYILPTDRVMGTCRSDETLRNRRGGKKKFIIVARARAFDTPLREKRCKSSSHPLPREPGRCTRAVRYTRSVASYVRRMIGPRQKNDHRLSCKRHHRRRSDYDRGATVIFLVLISRCLPWTVSPVPQPLPPSSPAVHRTYVRTTD
jgi:hypothetical protein